jgi:hypothetical protein
MLSADIGLWCPAFTKILSKRIPSCVILYSEVKIKTHVSIVATTQRDMSIHCSRSAISQSGPGTASVSIRLAKVIYKPAMLGIVKGAPDLAVDL